MNIHFQIDPNFLGASKPSEKIVSTYAQMYETIMKHIDGDMTDEEQAALKISFKMMKNYLEEINYWDLSNDFKMMRNLYVDLVDESITELENGKK